MVTVLKWRAQLEPILTHHSNNNEKRMSISQTKRFQHLKPGHSQCSHPNAAQFITLTFELRKKKIK